MSLLIEDGLLVEEQDLVFLGGRDYIERTMEVGRVDGGRKVSAKVICWASCG